MVRVESSRVGCENGGVWRGGGQASVPWRALSSNCRTVWDRAMNVARARVPAVSAPAACGTRAVQPWGVSSSAALVGPFGRSAVQLQQVECLCRKAEMRGRLRGRTRTGGNVRWSACVRRRIEHRGKNCEEWRVFEGWRSEDGVVAGADADADADAGASAGLQN